MSDSQWKSRTPRTARLAASCLLAFLVAVPSSARAQVTVVGRVADREDGEAIAGATVLLAGRAPILTDAAGTFRFTGLNAGGYSLTVTRIGYSFARRMLLVLRDTSIVIELDRAPVRLDTLTVEARRITLRGEVRDRATGTGLIEVDVHLLPDRQVETDAIGRFRLDRVPANTPVTIRVLEFGYLPVTVNVTASRDTTLRFELDPDPIVALMITAQKARIIDRAADRHYPYVGEIDRPALLAYDHGQVWDYVKYVLGPGAGRVQCYILDEKPVTLDGRAAVNRSLWSRSRSSRYRGGADTGRFFVFPGEVEYVDILRFGPRGLMVRAYTRDFVMRMTAGAAQLVPLDRIIEGAHLGRCR